MKAELQQLIALQNLDSTIRKLEKDQEAIQKGALRSKESSISAPLKLGLLKIDAMRQNTLALVWKTKSSNKEDEPNAPKET